MIVDDTLGGYGLTKMRPASHCLELANSGCSLGPFPTGMIRRIRGLPSLRHFFRVLVYSTDATFGPRVATL